MDINRMIQSLKDSPRFSGMGMIVGHLGVVRGESLDGGEVTAVEVKFDELALNKIIGDIRAMIGIIEVKVEIRWGRLKAGEDIMAVVIGGDTRQHVFPALMTAVDRIKAEAVEKKEFFKF